VERRSVTAGPYGSVHAHEGRWASAAGAFGAAGGYRGAAVGRFGGARGLAVGHATSFVSGAALRTRGAYVRGGYSGSAFSGGWYRGHPAAWQAAGLAAGNYWAAPEWPVVSDYCGISAEPIPYDYGSGAVIDGDNVYLDGLLLASAADYAGEALAFAARGQVAQPAADEVWQPLGVFGLIQGDEQTAQNVFQLAVNKAGIIRGNYYDAVADTNLPVYGSVDRTMQRVAWSVGDKKTVVFEAGLQNLTQNETTALVHYGTDRTEQMALVRLEQPQDAQEQPQDARAQPPDGQQERGGSQ
jgi:hypothetical protein